MNCACGQDRSKPGPSPRQEAGPCERVRPWSTARALALVAAVFAVVLGATLPFAASAAAARSGAEIMLCSAQGPKRIGGETDDGAAALGAGCAACVAAHVAPLPAPPVCEAAGLPALAPAVTGFGARRERKPPARPPPRPPSTAPPQS